jgi:hypothetical protein
VKSIQVEKQMKQAQLEPLQEDVEKILIDMDIPKGQMENIRLEDKYMLKENITT